LGTVKIEGHPDDVQDNVRFRGVNTSCSGSSHLRTYIEKPEARTQDQHHRFIQKRNLGLGVWLSSGKLV
jgi:hypothetical protein